MIKIEQASFAYPKETEGGLKDINLTVHAGECLLLCGRSGCGKTTLTRLINGLIPNFFTGELSGRVDVNGMAVFNTPMYQIAAHVGSVFQNPRTQFFNVDTDSEIAFGIENEAVPPEELNKRVSETANNLGINHLRGRNIFELSGGEKQKIAFASIYAMNPEVYLLDEPSSNLDMASIDELREQLSLIKRQGKTILIAEHRLYYLMDLADRIIYLSHGEIAGIYTPKVFRSIPHKMRKSMGLRAVDLEEIHPAPKPESRLCETLELKNVSLNYKKRTVLKGINLKASKGEIIAVAGRNGAGKTTFSRTLCGLHKEYSGQLLWNQRPQSGKDCSKRSYMGMQDVNYQLFAESVEAECTFGIRNAEPGLVEQTLSDLDLLPYSKVHPNTLSGGQKQRVAIAVSMMCGKELLVFDEPTSGLDYDSMTQAANLIEKLAAMGKVIFIVTHDYELICRVCTRILHFDEGVMTDDLALSTENEDKIRGLFHISHGPEGRGGER